MTRKSSVTTHHDSCGDYEAETFDCPNPKRVIVCVHGGGVRRWDGEQFFYAITEHYADSAVMLVDQNQQIGESIRISPLPVAAARISSLIDEAKRLYPGIPIIVIAHSFGCGVATRLDASAVSCFVMVTPAVGSSFESYVRRYNQDILKGKTVTTSDGLKKEYTAAFMDSIKGISWGAEYMRLLGKSIPVYVFEAGDDNIIGEERFALRELPFTKYFILDGAKHNLVGQPLKDFFVKLDPLLP